MSQLGHLHEKFWNSKQKQRNIGTWAEFKAGDDALAALTSRGYRVGNAGRFLSDTNGELVYPTYLE